MNHRDQVRLFQWIIQPEPSKSHWRFVHTLLFGPTGPMPALELSAIALVDVEIPEALRRFFSLAPPLATAKLPTGGIFVSPRPTWLACGVCAAPASCAALSAASAACCFAWAADSGKNCLKSSRRSCASLNRVVT
jgi:hypothetical protein